MPSKHIDERPMLMYVICDSDGHVRYVGQCCDVRKRMRNHLWSKTRVGDWLRSEVRCGRIPTARTLMCLSRMPRLHQGIARWSANALEAYLIQYFHLSQPGELLNVKDKPLAAKEPRAYWSPWISKCPITKMKYQAIVENYDSRRVVSVAK